MEEAVVRRQVAACDDEVGADAGQGVDDYGVAGDEADSGAMSQLHLARRLGRWDHQHAGPHGHRSHPRNHLHRLWVCAGRRFVLAREDPTLWVEIQQSWKLKKRWE
jgi:hypothetical protein